MECEALIADVAGAYVSENSGSPPPKFQTCELLNVSICPATEQNNVSDGAVVTKNSIQFACRTISMSI